MGALMVRCPLLVLLLVATCWAAATEDVARGRVFHDVNGNGVLDGGERGVKGVCLSNGREVVATDRKGHYELPVSDDTVLFVIKPPGWRTALDDDGISRGYYVHKPAGSPKTKDAGVAPTGPLPGSVDFPLVQHREPKQFEVLLFGDPQPEDSEGLEHYAHDVVEELVGSDAA